MKRFVATALTLFLLSSIASAQFTITGVVEAPLPNTQFWNAPQFSPNGRLLYVTTADYTGIWQLELQTGELRQLTNDRGAGYLFALSDDGKRIAYRRTLYPDNDWRRVQEVVEIEIATNRQTVIETAPTVSTPAFTGNSVVYSVDGVLRSPGRSTEIALLGIEATKIFVVRNGEKTLLDPLGEGSYIWPSLAPDKRALVAFEVTRGLFVASLDGKVQSMLGRYDAPVWARSGNWIVAMKEEDDGHVVIGSDLYAVSRDGKVRVKLTGDDETIELNPACSPVDNRIACSTLDGRILLMTYTEGQR